MENYSITLPDPEKIRLVLKKQDEHLQQLHQIVSSIMKENADDLHQAIAERLQSMEALEQQIWSSLFPRATEDFSSAHRMTMKPSSPVEQYY